MSNDCGACGAEVLDIDVRCPSCGAPLASTGAQRMLGSTVLGQYEIVDILGQGGMSVVYKGRHKLTEQEVALKILPPELAMHSQVKSRFLEEARALAQLDHPNIVHLYNFGEERGCFVLAMQFVQGGTFERMILDSEQLDWRVATLVAVDVLKALEYAHGRGVVHRDMKPSNVLVRDSDGSATVMDFGIAKMTTSSSKLTATGQTMGTVRYMSPEQVRGQSVDARTDLYSLGATLYEAVVGDTPFDGDTHFEIMNKHLTDPPPPPSEEGVDIPAELERAILWCLEKDVDSRPSSAAELRAVLEGVLGEGAGTAPPALERIRSSVARFATAPGDLGTAPTRRMEAERVRGLSPARAPAARQGKSRPVLWAVLSIAVLAAAAAVFVLVRAAARRAHTAAAPAAQQAASSQGAGARDAAPQRAAAPFLLPGLHIVVDRRFDHPPLRVLSVAKRDPAEIHDLYAAALRRFVAFLHAQGVARGVVTVPPLSVVITPKRDLCDRRLYADAHAWDSCAGRASWYRPHKETLYITTDAARWKDDLAYWATVHLCLHTAMKGCDDALTEYEATHAGRGRSRRSGTK